MNAGMPLKRNCVVCFLIGTLLLHASPVVGIGPTNSTKVAERIRRAENLAKIASVLLQRLVAADEGISPLALSQAKAIAVFPVVSGKKGFFDRQIKAEGVISRRIGRDIWSAPAFFEINRTAASGMKGSTSTVVLVLKGDYAVDRLRTSNVGDLKDLEIVEGPTKRKGASPLPTPDEDLDAEKPPIIRRGTAPTPTSKRDPEIVEESTKNKGATSPVRSRPNSSATSIDAYYYEYVDGVPIQPANLAGSINSKNSYNDAIYHTESPGILFDAKGDALEKANSLRGLNEFVTTVGTLPPNDETTPKINEFFPTGYDYTIAKSLDTIKEHMKDFFNAQRFPYRGEPTDDGVLITTFKDLEQRGERLRHASFLIKIVRMKEEYLCNVQFRWYVSSRGAKHERIYTTQPEDTKITNEDLLLNGYIQQIGAELERLRDGK